MTTRHLAFVASLLLACNNSSITNSDQPDMSPELDATPAPPDLVPPADLVPAPFPAVHDDPPQVITLGGPVLKAPKFVPIFFSDEDTQMRPQLEDFMTKIAASQYWAAATAEYGVGPATSLAPVELAEAAPTKIDDTAIKTWLAGKLNADDPALPAADSNSLYVLFYPAATTITYFNSLSCQSFGGYHGDFALDTVHNRQRVAYAVVPRCANFGGMSALDATTSSGSHELVEAATDPYPAQAQAYGTVDDDHIYWASTVGGGETGDMCAQFPGVYTPFDDLPFVVQRSWSDKAAMEGHDPCQPAIYATYFNSVPELTEGVVTRGGVSTLGVNVPLGTSKTINVNLFSDGPMSSWSVKAIDAAQWRGRPQTLKLTLDKTSGRNGDQLKLTITTMATSMSKTGTFLLISTSGQQTNYWFGIVGEQ